MKPLRLTEDFVSLSDFKTHASKLLNALVDRRQPLVITQHGKPSGVLLSPDEFDRLQERQRFLESVAAGLADAEAGRVMDTDDLRERLAARRHATE